MTRITELLDGYAGRLPDLKAAAPFSAGAVAARTLEKIREGPVSAATRKKARALTRTALLAAVLAGVLLLSALAAGGFDFSEIPEGLRLWLGIDNGAVPGYVTYDTVTFAEDARVADTDHDGDGELYISAPGSVMARSENLLLVYISVSTVTREQYESYVWRAQVEGREDWVAAEPNIQAGEEDAFYGSAESAGRSWVSLRLTFILDGDDTDTLRVTLCGGYESEDGRSFSVQRAGVFTADPGTLSPTVTVAFGEGVSFANSETGETGTILKADIAADQIIWYFKADGIYGLYRDAYGENRGGWTREEWLALNGRLMAWLNSFEDVIRGAALNFSDGTSRGYVLSTSGNYLESDVCMAVSDYRHRPIDMDKLESVTIGGQTFQIP